MEIVPSIMTRNPCYTKGKKIMVKGLMLHSVGCSQPLAEVFVKKWNNPGVDNPCVHAFIDGITGKVYQTLPWDHRGWHAGKGSKGSANDTHIGVEMCEPSAADIKYGSGASIECLNRDKAMAIVKRTYDAAVELFAFLCWKFDLDPLADGVIISHKEGHDRKIASGHVDPTHLWDGLQSGYTMDGFRRDVNLCLHREKTKIGDETEPKADPGQTQPEPIEPGDIVRIMQDAVYYTGDAMPDWVKVMEWKVKSVKGSRVVLGKNVAETNEINSPVDARYLIVVARRVLEEPAAPVRERMDISEEGVKFIMEFEGCKLSAYQCAAGVWTIGYGHTVGVKQSDKLSSEQEARALLDEDLKEYTGYVNTYIEKGVITFAPNQNQFDALTSFCYNRGSGRLRELVTGRDAAAVADGMLDYTFVNEKENEGLKRRRKAERELFLR